MKPTCYSLRRISDGTKIIGGTFGASFTSFDDAADWLAANAEVAVSPTGTVFFIYGGTPVYAYLSVDASETLKGKDALRQWRVEKRNHEDAEAEKNKDLERELEDLVDSLGLEGAVNKLRGV